MNIGRIYKITNFIFSSLNMSEDSWTKICLECILGTSNNGKIDVEVSECDIGLLRSIHIDCAESGEGVIFCSRECYGKVPSCGISHRLVV